MPSCGEKLQPVKTNILNKGIDYFIGRAGLDPRSQEAAAAREFSKKWLNPLASEEDILKQLKEVTKTADKKG